MGLSPFKIGLVKEGAAGVDKKDSPSKRRAAAEEGQEVINNNKNKSPSKRRSCERRLFVPSSPERDRSRDGALGSSFLRSRYDSLSRYYYRPNPDGRGGSVGTDNEDGEFVPAPGTWLVNSRLEIISYPIPGMFTRAEPGGVYIVEEEDDEDRNAQDVPKDYQETCSYTYCL